MRKDHRVALDDPFSQNGPCLTLPTRSVGMSLARRFNAGILRARCLRRVATTEFQVQASRCDDDNEVDAFPGVETPG